MSDPRCIQYLRDYIAIPSVNPMYRTDIPPEIVGEARYANHLREQLRGIGLDAQLIGDPDRPSILAEATVSGTDETVAVAPHLDTVPVDGMQIDPFDPRLEDGRVYGRGSCDTKSGMAALIAALERVLGSGTLRRNVLVIGQADEELRSSGAHAVLRHLDERPPDWILVTEPTNLRLVTRHKGVAHLRLVARGDAGHASDPSKGRNAIVSLARAVLALEELAAKLADQRDPEQGAGTLSVGTITGGCSPNIIPDEASLVLDRRFLLREDPEAVRAEIENALSQHGLHDVLVDWCRLEKFPLAIGDNRECVRRAQQALGEVGLPIETASASFGTDAGVFAQHGVPCVVLGPGSVEQAHAPHEWVLASQVEQMTDLLVRIFESG